MKKLILATLLFWSLNTNAQALKGQSEFGIGTGRASYYSLLASLVSDWTNDVLPQTFAINAWYRYHLTHSVAFGVGIGYERLSGFGRNPYKINCWGVTPELSWAYFDRNRKAGSANLKLYGAFSLGFAYLSNAMVYNNAVDEVNTISGGAMQLTPIGFRIGNNVAGFAEFGFGYKGAINLGFTARFP